MDWFTSDHHFDHTNAAIKFRGYSSVEEMNEELIKKWNSVIKPKDTVWHLGDFNFGQFDFLKMLNGHKFLVKGNHDKSVSKDWDGVYSSYHEIKRYKTRIVMCHYPLKSWNGMHKGSIHLFGHSHLDRQKMELEYSTTGAIHVGVDSWDGYPISLEQIFKIQKGDWSWNS